MYLLTIGYFNEINSERCIGLYECEKTAREQLIRIPTEEGDFVSIYDLEPIVGWDVNLIGGVSMVDMRIALFVQRAGHRSFVWVETTKEDPKWNDT